MTCGSTWSARATSPSSTTTRTRKTRERAGSRSWRAGGSRSEAPSRGIRSSCATTPTPWTRSPSSCSRWTRCRRWPAAPARTTPSHGRRGSRPRPGEGATMRFGVGSGPWAGLDIGTYSVKLVTLHPGGSRFRFAEALIPRTPSSDEPPTPAILAGLIDDCMSRTDQSPRGFRGISVAVSGPDVIVKQISLPLMDESEIPGALRYEARGHLPFGIESMVLDHQVLGRNTSERKLDLLLATVSQARLDRALAPLRELGVEAGIVDAAPLALANALAQATIKDIIDDSNVRLLLDVGHRESWLALHHQIGRAHV